MTRYEERIRALNPSAADIADMLMSEREALERAKNPKVAKDHAIKVVILRRLMHEREPQQLALFALTTLPQTTRGENLRSVLANRKGDA